jgi:hypothetical protein
MKVLSSTFIFLGMLFKEYHVRFLRSLVELTRLTYKDFMQKTAHTIKSKLELKAPLPNSD